MITIQISTGDTYPDLQGTVTWAGSLDTDGITGSLVANGQTTGPFTGAVGQLSFVNDPIESNWIFTYNLTTVDTVAGTYDLCVRMAHNNLDIETASLNMRVEVSDCA